MFLGRIAAILSLVACATTAFLPAPNSHRAFYTLRMAETETTSSSAATEKLAAPVSWDEMVRQAASAMKQAAQAGQTRQIVRVLLPRDKSANDLGQAIEVGVEDNLASAMLVPPDESWQGGIMQLYRAAAPTAQAMLRRYTDANVGVAPRIVEDRSVDESGVDGVGLFSTDQVECWLQPTQENVDAICDRVENSKGGLTVLVNPQWRQVDDALDTASRGEGFMASLASFLGGKGGSLQQLVDAGFAPVYSLEGYVCRGANVRLLQVQGSAWAVFCERDDGESFLPVGSSATRPTYQEVEVMLNDNDIGFKYARDIGLQEKL